MSSALSSIFTVILLPDFDGACIGQTWYLSCDMMLFILSPLLIYPLWMGKFGSVRRVLSILWWFIVFGTSCSFAYWYIYHMDTYGKWEEVGSYVREMF